MLETFAAFTDLIDDALILSDPQGRVMHVNPGCLTLFRLDRPGFVGRKLKAIPGFNAVFEVLKRGLESQSRSEGWGQYRGACDDEALPLRITCQVLVSGGQVCLALLRLEKWLESNGLSRSLRSQLRHEILTPLTVLVGFSELLLKRRAPEKKREEFLSIIHAEASRLAAHLDQILAPPSENHAGTEEHPAGDSA